MDSTIETKNQLKSLWEEYNANEIDANVSRLKKILDEAAEEMKASIEKEEDFPVVLEDSNIEHIESIESDSKDIPEVDNVSSSMPVINTVLPAEPIYAESAKFDIEVKNDGKDDGLYVSDVISEWQNKCGMNILRSGFPVIGYERWETRDLYNKIGELIKKWDDQKTRIDCVGQTLVASEVLTESAGKPIVNLCETKCEIETKPQPVSSIPCESFLVSSDRPLVKRVSDVIAENELKETGISGLKESEETILINCGNEIECNRWKAKFDKIADIVFDMHDLQTSLSKLSRKRKLNVVLDKVHFPKWRFSLLKETEALSVFVKDIMLDMNNLDDNSLISVKEIIKDSTIAGAMDQMPKINWDVVANELKIK